MRPIILEGFVLPGPVLIIVGYDGGKVTYPITLKIKNLRDTGGFVLTQQGLSQRKVGHVLGFLYAGEGPAALGVGQATYREADAERNVIRRNHLPFPLLPLPLLPLPLLLPAGLR